MNRPFDLKGLDHIVLRVRDLDISRHFYEQVLGCTLERSLEDLGLYQLRAGRALIDLVVIGTRLGGQQAVDQARANQDHFCLEVSEFDEATLQQYLQSHDVDCPAAGVRYGATGHGPSIYINDPDGNTVELKGPSK